MKEIEKLNFVNFGLKGDFEFMYYNNEDDELLKLGIKPLNPNNTFTSEDECITYMVLMDEINSFFYNNMEMIIAEAEKLCSLVGLEGKEVETKYYMEKVILKQFSSYLKNNEIEILCKIAREKSADYPSKYKVIKT